MPNPSLLATTPNEETNRTFRVDHVSDEFTFLHPLTQQPCFGRIEVSYVPDAACLETMALKQYTNSYREEAFHFEAVTHRILDDLIAACAPREMKVTIAFNVRGGIETTVTVESGR